MTVNLAWVAAPLTNWRGDWCPSTVGKAGSEELSRACTRQSINMYRWLPEWVMISFSWWYLESREGICLVLVSGVTAIATWSHRGDICLADKSARWMNLLWSIWPWGLKSSRMPSRSSLRWSVCCAASLAGGASGWAGLRPPVPTLHTDTDCLAHWRASSLKTDPCPMPLCPYREHRGGHCLFIKMNKEAKPEIWPPPVEETLA